MSSSCPYVNDLIFFYISSLFSYSLIHKTIFDRGLYKVLNTLPVEYSFIMIFICPLRFLWKAFTMDLSKHKISRSHCILELIIHCIWGLSSFIVLLIYWRKYQINIIPSKPSSWYEIFHLEKVWIYLDHFNQNKCDVQIFFALP